MDARNLSELASSSAQIRAGIDQLISGLQSMDGTIAAYYTGLAEQAQLTDMNALVSGNASLYDYLLNTYAPADAAVASLLPLLQQNQAYISASTQLISGIDAQLSASTESQTLMTGALSLQNNYKNFDSVIQSMVTTLNSLGTDMTKLKIGVDTLISKYSALDSGIHDYTDAVAQITDGYSAIYNGSDSLKSGTSELTKGTQEFYSETQNIDTEISDTIDKTIDELTGKEIETISFVSEKNTNVTSVLFVIKTPAIEKPETEAPQQTEEKTTNLWEKFKNLF